VYKKKGEENLSLSVKERGCRSRIAVKKRDEGTGPRMKRGTRNRGEKGGGVCFLVWGGGGGVFEEA